MRLLPRSLYLDSMPQNTGPKCFWNAACHVIWQSVTGSLKGSLKGKSLVRRGTCEHPQSQVPSTVSAICSLLPHHHYVFAEQFVKTLLSKLENIMTLHFFDFYKHPSSYELHTQCFCTVRSVLVLTKAQPN